MFSRRHSALSATLLLSGATLAGTVPTAAHAASRQPPPKSHAPRSVKPKPRSTPSTSSKARLKDVTTKAAVPNSEFISVSEIKPGMKGYGLTVFKGTKIEKFGVTVIDILHGGFSQTLGRDVIMIRTSGPIFDKRKNMSIGGMSGSPVYINGRLAGAYSYGAESQNEPVAFVTPIADMLEAWNAKLPQKPLFASAGGMASGGGGPFSMANLLPGRFQGLGAPAGPVVLGASGLSAPVMERLNRSFGPLGLRFEPTQAMAVGKSVMADKGPPIQGGSTFGLALSTGDIELGQSGGTVTYRKGNRVLTMGHPSLQMLGPMSVPMTTSYVVDVLSMSTASTKLQTNGSVIGTLTQDTAYGTAGIVGKKPEMSDVTVNVDNRVTGAHRTMHSKVMKHPLLTSRIIFAVADEAVYRMHTMPGDSMAQVKLSIKADGIRPITRTNFVYSPAMIDMFALQDLDDLLTILSRNEFGPVDVKAVNVDVKILPGRKSVRIERAFVDRSVVEPGDTVQVGVVLRPWRKEPYVKTVSVKVPENAPNGSTQIVVTNGATPVNISQAPPTLPGAPAVTAAAAAPSYRNVQQMVDRYLELGSNSQLTTRLFLTSPGINIMGERLYDVPAPISDVLRSQKSSGYRMERDSIKKTEELGEFITGAAIVPIKIEKSSYQEQGRTTARPAPRAPSAPGGSSPSVPTIAPPSTTTTGDVDDTLDSADTMDPDQTSQVPTIGTGRVSPTLRALGMFNDDTGLGVKPLYLATPSAFTLPRSSAVTGSATSTPDSDAKKDEKKDEKKPVGTAKAADDTAATETDSKPDDKKDDTATGSDDKTKGPGRTATLWTQKTKTQFERGDGVGVGVTTEGDIRLAPTLKRLELLEQEAQVWTIVSDGSGGYFIGTGNTGHVYHMDAAGKLGSPIETPELSIRAMALGKDGVVFAGGWPSGTIYKISGGKAAPFAKTDAKYVLSLVVDPSDNLFAAVGPGGKVLKITPAGGMSTFFQTSQPHVLSLALDKGNNLIVGTSDSGALYRVDPSGRSTVLYDPEDNAVTALLVDKDGDIYAGTSPKGRILDIKPNGTTRTVYEAGGPVMALEQDTEGNLYAGAGTSVIRVDPNSVVTRLDTKDQNQILGLKWSVQDGLWAVSGNLAGIYKSETRKESGEYLSPVHDAKNPARWGRINWQAKVPQNARVTLETRSGNTADPDASWSAWSAAYTDPDGSVITSPRGRFIQYRARFNEGDNDVSPELKSVTVSYLTENRPPAVSFTSPTVADIWSDKQTIRWNANDPDKDTLTYDLYYSSDGGATWKPIKKADAAGPKTTDAATKPDAQPTAGASETDANKPEAQEMLNKLQTELDKDKTMSPTDRALVDAILPTVVKDAVSSPGSKVIKPEPATPGAASSVDKPLTETSFSWDTKDVPDGDYFLKIVATDKRSNPTDPQKDEKVLGPVTIINAKPKVTLDDRMAEVKDRAVTVQGTTSGGKTVIATVSYRVDKGDWAAAEAADGIFDSPTESFRIATDPLTSGDHTIEVRATTVGNLNGTSSMKITVK